MLKFGHNLFKIFSKNKSYKTLQGRFYSNLTTSRVYIETYGCQMNFNDSEIALSIIQSSGYTTVVDICDADVVLLMTCAIRDSAEEKIWKRLKEIRRIQRRRTTTLKVGVLGCMAERVKSSLFDKALVDIVCGPDAYRDLPKLLEEAKAGRTGMSVALSWEETYGDISPIRKAADCVSSAYVSIMRGCDNMCTYCIVPFTRGRERSRSIDSILNEVRSLSDQGFKEVILLGQNVNSYRDLSETTSCTPTVSNEETHLSEGFSTVYRAKHGGRRFADLLDVVSRVNKEIRVRFTSPHPKDFPDEVISLIRERPNICKQLHLPAQSGSNAVLQRMGRGYTREAYLALVERVRSMIPEVSLTSDFIAGFCGETEHDHEETLSLLAAVKYGFVFCYPYSEREKTRACRRLVDDVPDEVKAHRHRQLSLAFRQYSLELNRAVVGSVQLVLVDGLSKRSSDDFVGRNDANIKTIFPKEPLPSDNDSNNVSLPNVGEYVAVRVVSGTSQTLRGEPLYRTSLAAFDPHTFPETAPRCSEARTP